MARHHAIPECGGVGEIVLVHDFTEFTVNSALVHVPLGHWYMHQ